METSLIVAFFLVILLLILIILFCIYASMNLSQGAERAQNAVDNLTQTQKEALDLRNDLNKTIGRIQTEVVTLGGFLLPLLNTPADVCQFCQIYGQQRLNYFTPTDAAIITVFCQKAKDIFQCS